MKLSTWFEHSDLSKAEFARRIGVHPSYVTHLLKGRRRPSPQLALEIEKATGGQVDRLETLYPDMPPRPLGEVRLFERY